MHPPQKRQAQGTAAGASELLLNIAFLRPESLEPRIEARPHGTPAAEYAEALHDDLERRGIRVRGSTIRSPDPVHSARPERLHMGGESTQVVVEKRTLQQIQGLRVCVQVVEQLAKRTGDKQNVRVHTQNEVRLRFAKNHVANRSAAGSVPRNVPITLDPILERLELLCAWTVGMIVDH